MFLGVDGGQSSTTALIGDESGRVVAMGRGGPCNDPASVADALRATGVPVPEFEAACFGFSGGFADKEDSVRGMVAAKRFLFTHDAHVALAGATGGQPGLVTIAGTGSIAYGRNAEGHTARAGGWGHAFGDEGSGFDIVRQAMRAALRQEEGWGPRTALHPALLAAADAPDANELLHRFYSAAYPKDRIAGFAKVVDETAAAGDPLARDILNGAAQSLATIAAAVRRQLFDSGADVCVSYIGGVFRSATILARYRMLMELEDGNRVVAPMYGPAAGALMEAYRIASMTRELRDVPAEKEI